MTQHAPPLIEDAAEPMPQPVIEQPWRLAGVVLSVGLVVAGLSHATLISGEPAGLGIGAAIATTSTVVFFGDTLLGARRPSIMSRRLSAGGAIFGLFVVLRSSPTLTTLNGLAAAALLAGAIVTYRYERRPPSYLTSLVRSGLGAIGGAVFEPLGFLRRDLLPSTEIDGGRTARLALGAILALPVVVVLTVLLGSADALFAEALIEIATVPTWFFSWLVVSAAWAWLALGATRWVAAPWSGHPTAIDYPRLHTDSALVVIGSASLVLAAFDATQLLRVWRAYGSDSVSFASQARSGFFELSTVMVVVVGLVLVVDWAVGTARGSVMLRRSYWALIGLTIPVVASAFVRLIVYIDAFGLTQLRALTTVGVVWMAGVLVWAGRTVVRGQRERFVEPAIAALLAVLVLINVANFDARIAQVNLAALGDQPLDQGYLSEGLSPDAIPTVADFIATSSDPCLHVDLAGRLWARERGDVRSWNLGASRAHAHIDRALAAVADCPPR